jgi:hypothetical protein
MEDEVMMFGNDTPQEVHESLTQIKLTALKALPITLERHSAALRACGVY